MQVRPRRVLATVAVLGAIALTSGCGGQGGKEDTGPVSDVVAGSEAPGDGSPGPDDSASPSPSVSGSPSASAGASPGASASASASKGAGKADTAGEGGTKSGSGTGSGTGAQNDAAPATAPDFPVPVTVGNATQMITVKASGSYATVTAWAKGSAGWKAQFSTGSGRVGSNGVTNGSTRHQGTYTTPTGTYTLTEGFGVESSGTAMPYHVVNSGDWWVEDPESQFYNSMHSATGADFPLTESGDRGSEHLVNYPTQYAKALVINFNRWPATPGPGRRYLPACQRQRCHRGLRVRAARDDRPDHGLGHAGPPPPDRHRLSPGPVTGPVAGPPGRPVARPTRLRPLAPPVGDRRPAPARGVARRRPPHRPRAAAVR